MFKTIAEYMIDVLREEGFMWEDTRLMDECASRATHTNLISLHPLVRHSRILTACERSGFFEKRYFHSREGKGQHYWRSMFLKGQKHLKGGKASPPCGRDQRVSEA